MPRYKLTIAYDGTEFCGWQKQEPPAGPGVSASKVMAAAPAWEDESGAEGGAPPQDANAAAAGDGPQRVILRTVQEVVERAVREVVREPVVLKGASRTDAGVHARGQVAAFTCSGDEPGPGEVAARPVRGWPAARGTETLVRAINSRLPHDVLVVGAEVVAPDFDPVGHCTGKGYSYTLHVSPVRPLWDRRYVQHLWTPLHVARMNEAAAKIVGEHDFAAFAAAGHGRLTTVRTVYECRVVIEEGTEARRHEGTKGGEGEEKGQKDDAPRWGRMRIEVSGNGFLYNMVRIIAGTLVEVGRGRMTPEDVAAAIESRDRRRAGPTLPPTGLCLEWVRYG